MDFRGNPIHGCICVIHLHQHDFKPLLFCAVMDGTFLVFASGWTRWTVGRIYQKAFLWAFGSTCLTFTLKVVLGDDVDLSSDILEDADFLEYTFTTVSQVAGFLVMFQFSQAYSRFWNGSQIIHSMMGSWRDWTSCCLAFCRNSAAPGEETRQFQHMFVRLVSLLNAMILGDLEGLEVAEAAMKQMHQTNSKDLATWSTARGLDFEVLDISSMSVDDVETVYCAGNRVEVVYHWLQTHLVEHVRTGVLSIPAPLLARVFHELGRGMLLYHEGLQLVKVPPPDPYRQTTQMMLVILSFMYPFVVSSSSQGLGWPIIFNFLFVFVYCGEPFWRRRQRLGPSDCSGGTEFSTHGPHATQSAQAATASHRLASARRETAKKDRQTTFLTFERLGRTRPDSRDLPRVGVGVPSRCPAASFRA